MNVNSDKVSLAQEASPKVFITVLRIILEVEMLSIHYKYKFVVRDKIADQKQLLS